MADACCQTVEELLSFVTFSVAATDLDPDQLVLGPKNSHRSLDGHTLPASDHLSANSGDVLKLFNFQR